LGGGKVRVGRGSGDMLANIAEQEILKGAEFVVLLTSARVVP